jgi:hypothetical protein
MTAPPKTPLTRPRASATVGPLAWALTCALAATAPPQAAADEPRALSDTQQLRQLTLDLFGRVPTHTELLRAQQEGYSADLAAELIAENGLDAFVRRYHSDELWPAFDPFSLVSYFAAGLLPAGFYELTGDPTRYFLYATSLYVRGALVPCKDEPATFDETGYPVLEAYPDGTMRDGWVEVEPYWAPGTTVKVCALEARQGALAFNGAPCASFEGMASGECGCGPSLERCLSPESAMVVEASLREQTLQMALAPIREGRSYFDMFTDKVEMVNGPLAHYYRYVVPAAVEPIIFEPPVPLEALPDLPYTANEWVPVERGPRHSGVLTSTLYLLRFQTARARASRFFSSFLCSPFQAPDTPLPSPSDPCTLEPNLRERCGCQYCHASLEPAAAHWGRFAEAGSLYLREELFPEYRPACKVCAEFGTCDFLCERFYFTQARHEKELPYLGMLKSYVFRDEGELANLDAGPAALVQSSVESGQLPNCTVRKLFERFYGRAMTQEERLEWLPEMVSRFEQSGYDFGDLVLAVVTDPRYGRLNP